jgi:hypothetical protein
MVLEVGWGEVDGMPFLFEKLRTHPSAFQQSQSHPANVSAYMKPSCLFSADVKPLLALLLFCMNSNVNM